MTRRYYYPLPTGGALVVEAENDLDAFDIMVAAHPEYDLDPNQVHVVCDECELPHRSKP